MQQLNAYIKLGDNHYREDFGLHFEDFQVGQKFKHRPGVTISQQDNKDEALDTINNAQLHYDAHYAAQTEWKHCLGVSTLTLQNVLGATWKTFCRKKRIIAYDDIAMTHPVFDQDTLYSESEIVKKEVYDNDPDVGLLHVITSGINQRGEIVSKIQYQILIYKKGKYPPDKSLSASMFELKDEKFSAYRKLDDGALMEEVGIYYEDLLIGEKYEHRPAKTFTAEEIKVHALRSLDWNPLYSNTAFSEKYNHGKIPVSEHFLIGAVTALTTRAFGRVVANLQWKNITLPEIVYAGDTVHAESTIISKRESKSRPEQGIMEAVTKAYNQNGKLVCSYERHFLMYRKGLGPYKKQDINMSYQSDYHSKLMTADKAIELIPKRGVISVGMAVSQPPALLKALEKKILAKKIDELRLYYMHSEVSMHDSILKYEYMDIIKPFPFYMGGTERDLVNRGLQENKKVIYYMPGNFSSVPGIIKEIGVDVFLLTVSPMDKAGFFSCGTNADYTIPTARIAKKVIIEVNPNMPRVFGDCNLHISDVHAIVENNTPLIALPARPTNALDKKIGKYIVEMVPDRATVQFGIGGVPNAVCEMLSAHKDLGVHSELMSPGLAALIQSGAVTNKYKNNHPNKNVYTIAMGDQAMYEFLNNNSSMEAHPVYHVNNPYIIGENDNVISVNAFLQVDFSGQVNAEFMKGRQFSAPGGQLDFVRGAQLSKNGKSILTAYSTAAKGTISRIVPILEGPATDPRADTHYVVTEYGVVNLRGKSTAERTIALIEIAHPDFRDELLKAAKKMGNI